jgi:hypothetical protein
MRLLIISVFAAAVLLAAAPTMLRSHSPAADHIVGSASVISSEELHTATDVNKLAIEEFEDQSLVYSKNKQ